MGFGVAHIVYREDISLNKEDGKYFYVGTPKYSAPEQFMDPEHVSAEADIFSLGLVLYELLTFEMPYKYGNRLSQYLDGVFPMPEPFDIPKPIYKILCKMLSPNPTERPSAAVLKENLDLIYRQLNDSKDVFHQV